VVWESEALAGDFARFILGRVLKVPRAPTNKPANGRSTSSKIGFRDPRFGGKIERLFSNHVALDFKLIAN
jgi:hypothetical protein